MKTPEEWVKEWQKDEPDDIWIIDAVQRESWNAAIDAAAENAEVEEKLGNPYDINSAYW